MKRSFWRILSIMSLTALATGVFAQSQLVRMPGGQVEKLEVERVEGRDIIEGDILIRREQKPSAVVIVEGQGKRWPNGVIPFRISKNLSDENRENAYRAMIEISYFTPIRFVERDESQKDFVLFTPSNKGICASHVGRKGGRQDVVLSPRCKKGSTMHELLHALGFWHEQSREDRDNFVDIRWENIREDKKHNFYKRIKNGIDMGNYDYGSIMHYSAKAFTKNGEETIVPLVAGKKIGQRDRLSPSDIKTIKSLYAQ